MAGLLVCIDSFHSFVGISTVLSQPKRRNVRRSEENETRKQFHQTVCVKMKRKKREYNEEYCAISHYVEEDAKRK